MRLTGERHLLQDALEVLGFSSMGKPRREAPGLPSVSTTNGRRILTGYLRLSVPTARTPASTPRAAATLCKIGFALQRKETSSRLVSPPSSMTRSMRPRRRSSAPQRCGLCLGDPLQTSHAMLDWLVSLPSVQVVFLHTSGLKAIGGGGQVLV